VEVSNSSCVNISTPVLVTVKVTPTANITTSGSTILCTNQSVTLSATTGPELTYKWYVNNTPLSYTSSSITVSASNPGIYKVVITNSNNCEASAVMQVQTIEVAITASGPLCAGGSTTLTANGSIVFPLQPVYIYTWQEYKNILLNIWEWVDIASSTSSITVTKAAKYRVKATNQVCTSISPEYTLTTISNPKPTISYTGDICTDGYLTLTSSVADSYRWSNGLTSRSINGYGGGSYYVTATYSSGCSNTSTTLGVSDCISDPCSDPYARLPYPCDQIALASSEAPITEAAAYPNPAKGKLTIRIPNRAEVDTPVNIVNQFGQTVKSQVLQKGKDRTEFNVQDMTNGIYIVQIKNITLKVFIDN
jgi:hypothetical protein